MSFGPSSPQSWKEDWYSLIFQATKELYRSSWKEVDLPIADFKVNQNCPYLTPAYLKYDSTFKVKSMLSSAEQIRRAKIASFQVSNLRLKMRARKATANRKTNVTGTTGREKVLAGTQDGIRARNQRSYCPTASILRLQPAHCVAGPQKERIRPTHTTCPHPHRVSRGFTD